MNFTQRLLLAFIYCTTIAFAQELPPLNIGTESFSPPFVMQGAKNEIYGFDIDMMNSLCKMLQRRCTYRVMRFDQLLPALVNGQLDLAISSITITPERSKIINFSLPYLLSYSRFVSKPSKNPEQFSLALLNGKKIGIEAGTVFQDQINTIGVKNATVKEYASVNDQLTALNNGEVDIILMDNPTATYWAANSSNTFKLTGPAYQYGYGLGIAANPREGALLTAINQALLQYQNSNDYKQNYNRYLIGVYE